ARPGGGFEADTAGPKNHPPTYAEVRNATEKYSPASALARAPLPNLRRSHRTPRSQKGRRRRTQGMAKASGRTAAAVQDQTSGSGQQQSRALSRLPKGCGGRVQNRRCRAVSASVLDGQAAE